MLVKEETIKIVNVHGPVGAGSSHGDFSVSILEKHPVGMDSSDHSGIYTFVVRDKVEPGALDFIIGIFGRNNRDLDNKELGIIFVHVHSAS